MCEIYILSYLSYLILSYLSHFYKCLNNNKKTSERYERITKLRLRYNFQPGHENLFLKMKEYSEHFKTYFHNRKFSGKGGEKPDNEEMSKFCMQDHQ